LNAAISEMSLFKIKFRLGQDIVKMFERFQKEVELIKGADHLFKRSLSLIIKHVNDGDVESIEEEFRIRINQIISSQGNNNFAQKMYQDKIQRFTFPPLPNHNFYIELCDVSESFRDSPIIFNTTQDFDEQMKVVMGKMFMEEWKSLDPQLISMRVHILRKDLSKSI